MSFELPRLATASANVLSTANLAPLLNPTSLTTAVVGLERASQSLLFVDGSVADYQQLLAGIAPGTEVHLLDSSQDAVTQITNTLLGRQNISSLHIVSHGEAGGLDFGTGKLNLKDLPEYAAQLQSWGKALTDDADILLYGCDVAQGELGQAFTSILSQLTGADVAASNDLTGSAALGGNWTLEYQTGSIEAGLAFSQSVRESYTHILPSFTAASSVAVGSNPYSVAIGDFNGDGKADFAAANINSNTVSVRLGDGLGGFSGSTNVNVGLRPISVAIRDFNGDGKADFAAANYDDNTVSIRLGDGLGGFSGSTTVAVESNPYSVATGDFNGDGKADFAAANQNSGTVSVWLGDGLGGFSGSTNVNVGLRPYSVAIGDFNGDGKADFAAANYSSNTVSIRLGDGLGGFSSTPDIAVGLNPISVAIGDFNGDGKADFAAANDGSNTVSVRLGDGLGGFSSTPDIAVGTNPQSVAIGDFNGDGKADFAAANYASGSVSVRLGDGLGGFSGTTNVTVGGNPNSVAIGNFNGDGKADIVAVNSSSNTVSVLLNTSPKITVAAGTAPAEIGTTGTFTLTLDQPAPIGGLTVNFTPSGTATKPVDYSFSTGSNITSVSANSFVIAAGATTATLNVVPVNDGIVDPNETVILTLAAGNDYFLGSNATAQFTAATNFTIGTSPISVAIGDFNGDGKADIAAANRGTNNVSVLLGTGSGSFGAATNFTVGTNPAFVAIGDFNGDGKADLAAANENSNSVSVLLGTGSGSFGAATNFTVGTNPASVAIGDFNGDGKADIAAANESTNNVSVLLGTGSGSFGAATNFTVGTNPRSVAIGDFNGDGKADIATANRGSNNVSVLLGIGSGSFAAATNFTVGVNPRSVAIGDFNGDGKADLATPNFDSNNVSVLLGIGSGSFGAATNVTVGTGPYSVAIGDFNGDGKADIAAANIVSNNVSVLLGTGSGSFGAATNVTVGTGPFSVAIGDFNGDGKADIAAANRDTNNVSVLLNAAPSATLVITDAPVNAAPVVTVSGTPLAYTENDPATVIDITATVTDSDSANFDTGTLTVNYTAGGTVDDRLVIRNQGNSTGQIGVSGSTMSYEGTAIGSFTGGTGTTALVITFNASATATAVSALLQNLTYANVSESPSAAARTVRFVVTDGDGGTSTAVTKTINVAAVDDTQFFVINTNDSGIGSLRQAVLDANADAGAETITFVGSTFTDTTPDTITLTTGLTLTGDTTITGTGANQLTVTGSSNPIFTINAGVTANLSQLTISLPADNNGIVNNGTASLNNLTFSSNGGEGNSQLTNSSTGTISVSNSTFNAAGTGTDIGINNQGTIALVSNSTFRGTGNSTGISNFATISTLVNNTIAGNNTGIANSGSGTIANLYNNLLVSNGNNTLPTATTASNNLTGTFAALNVDSTLRNNGGTTQTYALLPGSTAINTGTLTSAPTADQRGISRVGAVDIGAFESRGFTIAITGGNNQSAQVSTAFTSPLAVTVSSAFNEPVAGGKITYSSNGAEFADASLASNPATIDSAGNASTTATANGIAGGYTVTAGGSGIATAASFSLTNTPLNAPPTSADKSVTFNEDTVYTFSQTDFAFSDTDGGTFTSVKITQLPTVGQLFLDNDSDNAQGTGEAIAANQVIAVADLGKLKFKPAADANGTSYASFQFQVNDGISFSIAYTTTLNVTAVNDAPVVNAATLGVAENSTNGAIVGTVSASDVDAGQTLAYSLTGGNTGTAFTINASSGQITVADGTQLNFEGTPTYSLTVQAQDNGTGTLTGSNTITVNLTNVNEAPVVSTTTLSVAENSANGTIVGTVSASDVDAGQTLAYSITAGNTGTAFAINASNGQITVADGTQLNFEGTPTYSLIVQAQDNGTGTLTGSNTITVNLTNVNEAPVVSTTTLSVAENSANGTIVGTVSASDVDAGQTLAYSITAGNTGTAFAINASNGQITVADGTQLNFEGTPTYSLIVQAQDNGTGTLTGSNTITVNLTNVNEAPVVSTTTLSVAENSANGTIVGTVSASDVDAGQTLAYSLAAGNTGNAFAINASNGQITVADGTKLNFEGTPTYSLIVQAQDNGIGALTGSNTITVNLTNVNDAPTLTGNATLPAVTQNTTNPNGSTLISLFGPLFSDVDAGASFSGLAIVGNPASPNTEGTWQYSLDGTIWASVGTVDDATQALALSTSTQVRFVPSTNYNGTPPSLTVRALDNTYNGGFTTGGTTGSNRVLVNTTTTGGSTAIAGTTAALNTSVTQSLPNLLWRNSGSGLNAVWSLNNFTLQTSYYIPTLSDPAWQIASSAADFNNDGIADLLWRNQRTGENAIWQMNSTGLQSGYFITAVADANWQIVGTADFNRDSTPDLLWRNSRTGENAIWQMNGFSVQTAALITSVGDPNWQIVGTADFNGDSSADLVWRNSRTGENAIWQMNGFSLQTASFFTPIQDTNWQIVGTGDFNRDSKPDLVWRNSRTGENAIWQMNGVTLQSGYFIDRLADVNWQITGVADLGSDSTPELLWRNKTAGKAMIWQLNGFSYSQTFALPDVTDRNWSVKPFVAAPNPAA